MMQRAKQLRTRLADTLAGAEEGHAKSGLGALIGAAGAVMLGIGAASDTGWLAITGGIVLAVGVIAAGVVYHAVVDYEIYARLESLEQKD